MASLHRKSARENWSVAFRTADGRHHFMSTGTRNQAQAELLRKKLSNAIKATRWFARRGKLTTERCREIIETAVRELQLMLAAPAEGETVRDFFTAWLKEKESTGAETTLDRYQGIVARWLEWLGERADESLELVEKGDVAAFRDALTEDVSASTVNTYLKVLRVALGRAVRDELIDRNPAALVENCRVTTRSVRRAFTLDELKRLLEIATDEWRTMIVAGMYTGLRLQDAANLTWQNVDLHRQEITVSTRKTGRMVILPVARALQSHLQSLPTSDDPKAALCPTLRGRTSGWLSNQFFDLMTAAGLAVARDHQRGFAVTLGNGSRIEGRLKSESRHELVITTAAGETKKIAKADVKERRDGKGRGGRRTMNEVSFHALRHTATSLLKNAGVSDVIARDLIGHESEAISRVYTHIDDAAKRKAVNLIPDIFALMEQRELRMDRE